MYKEEAVLLTETVSLSLMFPSLKMFNLVYVTICFSLLEYQDKVLVTETCIM